MSKRERIVAFDMWGRYIRTYSSLYGCSRETGISAKRLVKLVETGEFEQKVGLFFDYELDEEDFV